jgi:TolB protein
MNDDLRLHRTATELLDAAAPTRAPAGLLADTLASVGRTRQRASWLANLKEPPMRTPNGVAVGSPTFRLVSIASLTLALALGLTAAVAGGASLLLKAADVPLPAGIAKNGLIAYDLAGDIWVVEPDGSDARLLLGGPTIDWGPVWSRNGSRLAYWSRESESDDQWSLMVVASDGTSPAAVASYDDRDDGEEPEPLDWSPDGTRIAYSVCGLAQPCSERIIVAATDGSGAAQVGDPSLRAWGPKWSPDGSLIAFGGGVGSDQGVYLMAPDGSDVRRLSRVTDPTDYAFVQVDWSPDGTRIVSQADPTGGPHDLWVFAADGSGESELAGAPSNSRLPSWSPDGTRIAFNAAEASGLYLSVIPAEGGEVTRLASVDNSWSWSPDSTQILRPFPPGFGVLDATTGDEVWDLEGPSGGHWQRIAAP